MTVSGYRSWRFYWLWIAIGLYTLDDRDLLTHAFEWTED